jgi:hypothetical protein
MWMGLDDHVHGGPGRGRAPCTWSWSGWYVGRGTTTTISPRGTASYVRALARLARSGAGRDVGGHAITSTGDRRRSSPLHVFVVGVGRGSGRPTTIRSKGPRHRRGIARCVVGVAVDDPPRSRTPGDHDVSSPLPRGRGRLDVDAAAHLKNLGASRRCVLQPHVLDREPQRGSRWEHDPDKFGIRFDAHCHAVRVVGGPERGQAP